MPRKKKEIKVEPATPANSPFIKLDLGCGKNKIAPDWIGVDSINFPGVDVVTDLTQKWQWLDNSVDEVHCSHFIEHLNAQQRIHFCNELYRVLKPGAKASVIAPHWSSCRAYGDMTHQWPPVSEFWFYYLDKNWRVGNAAAGVPANAPHDDIEFNPNGYNCDFAITWGYSLPPAISVRNQEYQNEAMNHWKDVCQDVISTWVKKRI